MLLGLRILFFFIEINVPIYFFRKDEILFFKEKLNIYNGDIFNCERVCQWRSHLIHNGFHVIFYQDMPRPERTGLVQGGRGPRKIRRAPPIHCSRYPANLLGSLWNVKNPICSIGSNIFLLQSVQAKPPNIYFIFMSSKTFKKRFLVIILNCRKLILGFIQTPKYCFKLNIVARMVLPNS